MDLLKLIKNSLVEPEDEASSATPTTPKPSGKPTASTGAAPAPIPQHINLNVIPDGDKRKGFVDLIHGKINTSPHAAVVKGFLDTVESLADAIPDDGGRYRAAMKLLGKTQNLTPTMLRTAHEASNEIINGEVTKFSSMVQQATTTRNNTMADLEKQIADLTAKRDSLIKQSEAETVLSVSFAQAVEQVQAETRDALQKLRIYFPDAAK
jgi:hypothetical protein